jgi:hypothetical protein
MQCRVEQHTRTRIAVVASYTTNGISRKHLAHTLALLLHTHKPRTRTYARAAFLTETVVGALMVVVVVVAVVGW